MNSYELIKSTLGGIYSAQVGMSDSEAREALKKDLEYLPFRVGLEEELKSAFADPEIRWSELLYEFDVGYFASEEEAVKFVREHLWDMVFGSRVSG